MATKKFLKLARLYFSLSRILVQFLILIHLRINLCEAKSIWCCRGWSDDVSPNSKLTQVETKECKAMDICRGETSCTDTTSKDCATNWECGESGSAGWPNKTDDDCLKPDVGKICGCDAPFCNCPEFLKGVKTPERSKKIKCCVGENGNAPERAYTFTYPGECVQHPDKNNITTWGCDVSAGRLRERCYEFSYKKYGYESDWCRCTTDRCNCPGGAGSTRSRTTGISNSVFKTLFLFSICFLRYFQVQI